MSVLSVVKLRLSSASNIIEQASKVLEAEARTMPGFLSGEVIVSLDGKTVVILTEWTDRHAWAQSRYDARVGSMLEGCLAASTELEFELYERFSQFYGEKPREGQSAARRR